MKCVNSGVVQVNIMRKKLLLCISDTTVWIFVVVVVVVTLVLIHSSDHPLDTPFLKFIFTVVPLMAVNLITFWKDHITTILFKI